jgi:hypothetical protein
MSASGGGSGQAGSGTSSGAAASGGGSAPTCATDVDNVAIDGTLAGLATPFTLTGGPNAFWGAFVTTGAPNTSISAVVPLPSNVGLLIQLGTLADAGPVTGATFTVAKGDPALGIDVYTSAMKFPFCRLAPGSTFTINAFSGDLTPGPSPVLNAINVSWSGMCEANADAGEPTASPIAGCLNLGGRSDGG